MYISDSSGLDVEAMDLVGGAPMVYSLASLCVCIFRQKRQHAQIPETTEITDVVLLSVWLFGFLCEAF